MRVEDPEQRPDREVIEGTGASSSRGGAGNEPPPRTVESSVSADQPPREQSDDADMGDPESDRKRPRVGWGGNGDKESQDQRLRWRRKRFRREESPEFAALTEENGGSLTDGQHSLLRFLQQGSLPRELIVERLGVHRVVERHQRSATMIKFWTDGDFFS